MNALEWTALGVAVTVLSTVIGLVVRLMDRLNKSEAKADAAEKTADGAVISFHTNKLEIERVEADLVDHRVAVAREYVSKDTLVSLETRIVDAINRLGDRLDKILQAR